MQVETLSEAVSAVEAVANYPLEVLRYGWEFPGGWVIPTRDVTVPPEFPEEDALLAVVDRGGSVQFSTYVQIMDVIASGTLVGDRPQ